MIIALVIGAVIGLGALVVVRAVSAPAVPLGSALAALDRRAVRPTADQPPPPPRPERWLVAAAPWAVRSAAAGRAADLRVAGWTETRFAAEKLMAAVCGAALPPALALLVALGGVGGVPIGLAAAASVALAVCGWFLPDLTLRDLARRRRAQLRSALSSYLDLVNIVLAGGAGIETALEAAADAGDGWAFAELRGALARGRVHRLSPWTCFAELGEELGVTELCELAASVRLAGEQGARIKASLAAKAASLRGHQLAEVEAAAQSATERMALPTVLMFTGFLLFIGYPAVAQILGGSGW